MLGVLRGFFVIVGVLMVGLAFGVAFQQSWALWIWPWPDTPLSYLFVASIQAAIAAALLYLGISGEMEAVAAGALNLFVMLTGMVIYLYLLSRQPEMAYLLPYVIGAAVFAIASLIVFLIWVRKPTRRDHPIPFLVKFSYVLYVVVLVVVGTALIRQMPGIFPWPLKPETSVMIGLIFIGDAFYFFYGLLRPYWPYSRAQLWSFLAYDLVLIYPFINHFSRVAPELRMSLIVYTGVLIYSALISIYYLFISRQPRRGRTPHRALSPYSLVRPS